MVWGYFVCCFVLFTWTKFFTNALAQPVMDSNNCVNFHLYYLTWFLRYACLNWTTRRILLSWKIQLLIMWFKPLLGCMFFWDWYVRSWIWDVQISNVVGKPVIPIYYISTTVVSDNNRCFTYTAVTIIYAIQ